MNIVIHKKTIIAILVILWVGFLAFSVLDGIGVFGLTDIGMQKTFLSSQLARTMFIDVSILSILATIWILYDGFTTKMGKSVAFSLAILTIFVGSAGVLLYLIIKLSSSPKQKYVINSAAITNSWGPFRIQRYK